MTDKYIYTIDVVDGEACYSCQRWHGRTFTNFEDIPDISDHVHCNCKIKV